MRQLLFLLSLNNVLPSKLTKFFGNGTIHKLMRFDKLDEEDSLPIFGNLTISILSSNVVYYFNSSPKPPSFSSHACISDEVFSFFVHSLCFTRMLKYCLIVNITLKVSFTIGIHIKLISFCVGTC